MVLFQISIITLNLVFILTLFHFLRAFNTFVVVEKTIKQHAPPLSEDDFEKAAQPFRKQVFICVVFMVLLVMTALLTLFTYLHRL